MKIFIALLTIFCLIEPTSLSWQRLSWADFKGRPDGSGVSMAATEMRLKTNKIGMTFYFKASASFIPQKSFTTTQSDNVLNHEQLHFDITELYARKINQSIQKFQGCGYVEYKKVYLIYDSLCILWNKEQDRYDAETNHSLNEEKQCEWERKINSQL